MTTENINYPVLTLTEVSRSLSADTHKNADYTVPGVEGIPLPMRYKAVYKA